MNDEALYEALLLPRLIEEKMLLLLRQGRLSKWFSGIGQEAISVGVTAGLRADDYLLPLHRNLGVFTTRGVDRPRLLRQLLGRDGGFTKGRDRTFHFGDLAHHVVGMISHLGAMLPVADGLALAAQLAGTGQVAAAFIGDGGTSEGDFHEAVNLAAVWALPVVFVIENNQYALSTPTAQQYACRDLADRAPGYGIAGAIVDGNDVVAVRRATMQAAARARAGGGPTLLECKTFRMRGHEEASGVAYVPPERFVEWAARDPIHRFEAQLTERRSLPEDARAEIRRRLIARIDSEVEEALAAPPPASSAEAESADVFAPSRLRVVHPEPGAPTRELRYIDAVSDGLRIAMARNPRALLIGQDIADYGGVFKATAGLLEEFGPARVRNTPIIESGALGAALGLSLAGFMPMVEMQFGDFISCGFNQVVNNIAKTHYRWGAPVGLVIRAPIGGGTGAGPFHSQNVEAWFAHVAGLKIVAPATPYDAKGLLLSAFEDGNPVLYLEHKRLYRGVKSEVPEGHYTVPIGRARIVRAGSSATIVTYGAPVFWALEAAETLAADGIAVEVIDLRSLVPWDVETCLQSLRRTSRALVLHEAPLFAGLGAEIAATLGQLGFEWLDAPIARVCGLDTPVPFSSRLEEIHSPRARLVPALRELVRY